VLVVVGSAHDRSARAIVERWAPFGAGMVTCEDLSMIGWRHRSRSPDHSTAVVGGRSVDGRGITGVLTRRHRVFKEELVHIHPGDRDYVAAEMTAFLTSWLSSLSCRVLNRPTPGCLSGPDWRPEQWARAANRIGIPVRPSRRQVNRAPVSEESVADSRPVPVIVLGDRWFGAVDHVLASQARDLAAAAGVKLLEVRFDGAQAGSRFVGADLWPDLGSDAVADAILEYLGGGSPSDFAA
jgi:hypothetical protein